MVHDPDRACQQTRFAASLDAGESFLAPVRVSGQASPVLGSCSFRSVGCKTAAFTLSIRARLDLP